MVLRMTLQEAMRKGYLKKSGVSKYHNKKTEFRGIVYDSKREARYAQELYLRMKAGEIIKIENQVSFPVVVAGKKICTYIADFRIHYRQGRMEVIDVKGMKTPVYRLKKKLVEALYGIEIIEE